MSEHYKWSGIDRVMWALDLNAENPRTAFLEEFGLKPTDVKIDQDLERLVRDALCYYSPRETAKVPLYLLAALILRRKRGNPKPITWEERRQRGRILSELRAKARHREPGESAIDALWRVAEEGAKELKLSPETVKRWLTSKPNHERVKRPKPLISKAKSRALNRPI